MSTGRIAVIGCGGWGTALAVHFSQCGHDVSLWGRDSGLVDNIRSDGRNELYLPGVSFLPNLRATAALDAALLNASYVVIAVPSHGLRDVVKAIAPHLSPDTRIVSAAKGIEQGSLLRMSEVVSQELGVSRSIGVLSGPSFAAEVARGAPTAVVVAGKDSEFIARLQEDFRSPTFRLYGSDDLVGVEIGGALKNVIAIAAGVSESLGLGNNALAALVTRGLTEISRLATSLGGRRETLSGLSGLGDLVLTCTGDLSRNRRLGLALGRGESLDDILAGTRTVAEGVKTTQAALALSKLQGIELPIAFQMAEVLAGRKAPAVAVEDLMLRQQRHEIDG